MSQTITYKCDRCGKESIDKDELNLRIVGIGIKVDKYSSYQDRSYDLKDYYNREKEMCEGCRRELGIIEPMKKATGGLIMPVPPTLEEVIREIVRSEIENHS